MSSESEFTELFADEARTRLDRMSALLLELEADISRRDLIDSLFREAHTIKGGGGMVGLPDVSVAAHHIENLLQKLRTGELLATPAIVDAVLKTAELLRVVLVKGLAHEDVTGDVEMIREVISASLAVPSPDPPPPGPGTSFALDETAPVDLPQEAAPTVSEPEVATETPVPLVEPVASPVAESVPQATSAHRKLQPVTSVQPMDISDEPAVIVQVPVERLDDLMHRVAEATAMHLRVGHALGEIIHRDPVSVAEYHAMGLVFNRLQEVVMRMRMVAFETAAVRLQVAARSVSREVGKSVQLEIRGGDTELDRSILEQLFAPLLQLVRNAIDHGIESPEERQAAGKPAQATVRLHAMPLGSEVLISITDDGQGIDMDAVRRGADKLGMDITKLDPRDTVNLIFRSGLSTSEVTTHISGRGVGMDIVRAGLERVRGRVEVHTEAGKGTEFRLYVPMTMAVMPCVIVEVSGARLALPLQAVMSILGPADSKVVSIGGEPSIMAGDRPVTFAGLSSVLELPGSNRGEILVVSGLTRSFAFQVDAVVGRRDVVIQALPVTIPRSSIIAGASVEPDGSILVVLEPRALIDGARRRHRTSEAPAVESPSEPREKPRVLVVDDALAVRELQRSILERAGYDVRVAGDGKQALAVLSEHEVDIVLTDVEMPEMDGLELTRSLRRHARLRNLPVVILTSRTGDEDRRRGLDAGADAYITKQGFDERSLLHVVERLLGKSR